MRAIRLAAALALPGLGVAVPPAQAAGSPQSQTFAGTIQAAAVAPVALSSTANLRFGQFSSPTASGTIVVSVTGAVSTTGGMTAAAGITQNGGGRGPGTFAINGNANQLFIVAMPSTITLTNGAATMQASALNNGSLLNLGVGILDNTGNFNLPVGATLTVPANQAIGTYSGSYAVTVTYL